MAATDFSANEICAWLKVILSTQNADKLKLKIVGTSEKGDGQCGEVIFVEAVTNDESCTQNYSLALKCSKSSSALMAQSPLIRDAFRNEIYLYEKIFPAFKKFQTDRGITDPFESVPKYYGRYSDAAKDVIALENLKQEGYEMWNPCVPLTRRHIDLVVAEYAKFHGTSIAMKELQPENFRELIDGFSEDIFNKFFRSYSREIYFTNVVQEVHDLLKDELDRNSLEKWLGFKGRIHDIVFGTTSEANMKVITHGDCWSNNFIYKYKKTSATKVKLLDWQMARVASPVTDLSYFLFACISKEDIADMDDILGNYYKWLLEHLSKVGSTFGTKYSLEDFKEEWKELSKFGLMMSIALIKGSFSRRGGGKTEYKHRVQPLVRYAVELEII